MKRKHLLLVNVFLVLIVGFVFLNFMNNKKSKNNGGKVCFEDKCFSVEIAQSEAERATGLMNREKLESDKGMLFVFDSIGEYNFWMKNTLISLDIIWISSGKKIVFIKSNTQPGNQEVYERIEPKVAAKYVLEINGGLAEKLGVKEGDDVFIEY